MNVFEIEDALRSFSVIVDTREQNTVRASERYASFGVPAERATLSYGDYCANIILPSAKPLHNIWKKVSAPCVVERKMSLDELAMCFTRGRDRFRREFERASANSAKIYLLVENASWEAIINHRYRSRYNERAFLASITAGCVRYGAVPIFCKHTTSGALIKELLYRDIKERLEKGEYG